MKYVPAARALLFFFFILISACASINATGHLFDGHVDRREGYGTLVLFRPPLLAGSAWFPTVRIDQTPVAELVNGGYTAIALRPGQYHLTGNGRFDDLYETNFAIQAGSTTFVEFQIDVQGVGGVTPIGGLFVPSGGIQIRHIQWVVTEERPTLPVGLAECRYFSPIQMSL